MNTFSTTQAEGFVDGFIAKEGEKEMRAHWTGREETKEDFARKIGLQVLEKATEFDSKIMREVYEVIRKMGGKSDLLGIIGSYGDTMSREDVLDALISYNAS